MQSTSRQGKRLILELRASKDGDGFDTTCRFNVRTGFAALVN
ncbi:MAG: hypothetical protein R3C97_15955 [Geminicoccaceae bacterium]